MHISNNNESDNNESSTDFNLLEHQKHADMLSSLDAAFGPDEKNISILSRCLIDLDFNNQKESLNNFCTKLEDVNRMRLQVFDAIGVDKRFFFHFYILFGSKKEGHIL